MISGKQYTAADVLAIGRRRKWLILVPFAVVTLGTVGVTRLLPNRYRSETVILVVPQRVPESYVKSTVTARIEDRLQSISQQILSRTRLERIILDFNLYATRRQTGLMEDIVERMRRDDVEVDLVKGDAFRVRYSGDDPQTVKKVTERLASLFIDENLRDRAVLAEDSYQFLDSQLDDARRRLKEHESKLEVYRRRYSGQLPSQLESNLQVMQNTQLQIQTLTESMARDRDRRLFVERAIADASAPEPTPAVTALVRTPEGPGSAAQQLAAAEETLRQMESRLTPVHPDIVRMKRIIDGLRANLPADGGPSTEPAELPAATYTGSVRHNKLKELQAELQNIDRQISRKEAEERLLRGVVSVYQGRVEATPTRESELIELTRDYDTLQKSYTSLLGKKEDSKIAANLEQRQIGEQFKMLDPARVAEKPNWPDRRRLNLMGLVFGLGFGLGLAALVEFFDSTLNTEDEVMVALSLPVLAMIPMMTTPHDQQRAGRPRTVAAVASSAVVVVAVAAWKLYF